MSTTALVFADTQKTQDFHPVFAKIYRLTIIERTLHALERAGVDKAILICGENETQLKQLLATKQPKVIEVELYKIFDKNVIPSNDFFVVSTPLVVTPDIFKNLKEDSLNAGKSITISKNGLTKYFPEATNNQNTTKQQLLAAKGKVIDNPSLICTTIATKAEFNQTKKLLIKSLTKSTDGWVSRNLNRPISTSFSRVLAYTPITPNQFTLVTGIIALITGYFMVMGGYWNWLIGAGLFHLTSILDGVDGELARLKFKSSPFGQWLDTVVDNLSYIVGLGGLIVGVYRNGITPAVQWAGIFAVIFSVLALSSLYLYLLRFGKGGTLLNVEYGYQNGTGWYPKMMNVLAAFGKRDLFALLFFALAIFGHLPMALGYVAIMAGAVFGFSIQAHVLAARKVKK